MKANINFLFLIFLITCYQTSSAQQLEWILYGGKTGSPTGGGGINIDNANNVYLSGGATLGPNDSMQLSGTIQPYLKSKFILKLNNQGNFINSVNFPSSIGDYIAFDNSANMYIASSGFGNYYLNILDSSLNPINSYNLNVATWGTSLKNYHLSKNGSSYFSGFHPTHPTQVNNRFDSFTFSYLGNVSYKCNSSLFCTDIYKGDSVGNDYCVYYDGYVERNGISTLIHPVDTGAPLSEINFNTDSTYSLFGRCISQIPAQLILDSNYFAHYFLSRINETGNCLWIIPIECKVSFINSKPVFDSDGNCFLNVYVKDSVRIANTVIKSTNGLIANYIIKINSNGLLEWFFPVSFSASADLGISHITLDNLKNIFVTGSYASVVDSLPSINIVNYGTIVSDITDFASSTSCNKAFFAKYSQPQSRNIAICPGDSVYFGGTYHSTAGVYYDTLSVNAPNDSIIVLTLSINALLNASVLQSNDTLFATATGAINYQWLNCDSNIVYNFNQPYFIPSHAGNYAAIAQNGSCTDTSACINYVTTSINNLSNAGKVSIYPNPTYTSITINFANKIVPLNTKAVLYDINSKKVMEVAVNTNGQTVNLNKLNQGMYMLTLISDKELFRSMVVKLP